MPKPPKKAVSSSESPIQKTPGLRTGRRRKVAPPHLPDPICRTLSRFAEKFREEHGYQDPRTAERIGRLLKSSITPRRRRGRPVTPEVRRAAELREQGASWATIYSAEIPGFADMDKYERAYPTQRLRDNVTAYLKRRKRHRSKSEQGTNQGA